MPNTAEAKPKAPARKRTRARKPQTRNGRVQKAAKSDVLTTAQRPIWIAVGAVALAADAVQDFFDESLKRGKKLEKQARKELKRDTTEARKAVKDTRKKAKKVVKEGERIADRVLHALEIPTHADIVSLEKKVEALAKKVA